MAITPKESLSISQQIEQAEEEFNNTASIPAGYLEIKLTSNGFYGAPKTFHVKNFSTEDLMHLAISDETELPMRTVEFLNGIIWEDDVDAAEFHEKEVRETLLRLFMTYYNSSNITDLPWEYTDEDVQYLKTVYGDGTAEFNEHMDALDNGSWTPRYDINLKDINFYPPAERTSIARVKKESTGFSCVYSWPRYGDILKIKKYSDIIFKARDDKYAPWQKILRNRQKAEKAVFEDGRNINLNAVPDLSDNQKTELRQYQEEKLAFMTTCMRAIQLREIRGVDISGLDLKDRIEYAQDPELDFATFKKIQAAFNDELKIGPIEEMTVLDPIQNRLVTRNVTFPIFNLISAIRDGEPDDVTIEFE